LQGFVPTARAAKTSLRRGFHVGIDGRVERGDYS
jgi:hypothetical protein